MYNPLVSIIIPVYNGSNYLNNAIDCALSQTYNNIEILVVNDGSNDNGATEQIALSYENKIRYFYKENGGVSSALNLGINQMRGEWFSWLSHDDLYLSTKIEEQIGGTESYRTSVVYGGTQYIDKTGKHINKKHKKQFTAGVNDFRFALKRIFKKGSLSGCAFLISKDIFNTIGLFNEHYRYIQDYDMWVRIFLAGFNLTYVDNQSTLSRIHGNQMTVTRKDLFIKEQEDFGKDMIWQLYDKQEIALLKTYMYRCLISNNIKVADEAYVMLRNAKKTNPIVWIKRKALKFYGGIRPLLVRCYYKLKYGLNVK